MEGGNIKAISRSSVHKICSGQVVLTLATAVKELVENSIDAGATIIEIKLKEYGSELIEVIDNGKGVESCDFQNLTLKHHTSKINDFSDVPYVSTFGFRGEALSSLCALSNLEITTCHADSPVGSLLNFNQDGVLIKKTPTHRQVGTTVSLKNLFHTLPVRHKEFLKNIRKEYGKMLHLLTAYCLISLDKRISCTNISDKGKKTIVISTNNADTIKNNILCIFGSKQMDHLLEISQLNPSNSVLEEYFLPSSAAEKYKIFKIEGFVSSSIHGKGRSAADRQFYFINGRPCDLPKISKLVNEIYHLFNKNQYPFVLMNIVLTEGFADVNVTPDKRQVFILEEKLLLAIIKTSILALYESQPSQIVPCSIENQQKNIVSSMAMMFSCQGDKRLVDASLKRSFACNSDSEEIIPPVKNQRLDNETAACKNLLSDKIVAENNVAACKLQNSISTFKSNFIKKSPQKTSIDHCNPKKINFISMHNVEDMKKVNCEKLCYTEGLSQFAHLVSSSGSNLKTLHGNSIVRNNHDDLNKTSNMFSKFALNGRSDLSHLKENNLNESIHRFKENEVTKKTILTNDSIKNTEKKLCENGASLVNETKTEELISVLDDPISRKKYYKTIQFNLKVLKEMVNNAGNRPFDSKKCSFRKFRSKISPNENGVAEEELRKEISKENFSQMAVIGQFNLGFIITKLNDDLFIIDQHATDEKYNFEILQKETVLETQKLLNPQSLSLTAVSETILLDHMHIFEKNGFQFCIEDNNNIGNRVSLISVPVSKNWSFGKEDVDELIFMLTDNPIQMVRPSRVNQMFASRACRKSVMIGTALSYSLMKKLVLHMSEIEQPWNCPHGRPTIRHLFNLNLLDQIN